MVRINAPARRRRGLAMGERRSASVTQAKLRRKPTIRPLRLGHGSVVSAGNRS